jgi:N-acetyl-anhydromuramyl-L-alanine amidase AmpD
MIPIQKGAIGPKVLEIQLALKKSGINIDTDSKFGNDTEKAVIQFQELNNLEVDGIVGENTYNLLVLGKRIEVKKGSLKCVDLVYHTNDYYKSINNKNQICLHHTAGPASAKNTVDWWLTDINSTGTAFVIGGKDGKKDGEIVEAHPSENWQWHLGVDPRFSNGFSNRDKNGVILDSKCIGIEICNWGYLNKSGNNFFSYAGTIVNQNDVCDLGKKIRGKQYFQKYTDSQINSTKKLLLELAEKHSIELHKTYDWSWFELSNDALSGKSGVWNHCNFRSDKIDIYPQQEILDMLNSL